MSIGLATDGYYGGAGGGAGALYAPNLSNLVPGENLTPGAIGAFAAAFSTARMTPIEFDITNVAPGSLISILVKFGDRDEMYTALDFDGAWRWPFDITAPNANSIGSLIVEPVHVTLLPRGGWRKGVAEIMVGASLKAVGA